LLEVSNEVAHCADSAVRRFAAGGHVDPRRVVSHVLDWETLPDELPELHTKPVFVRDPISALV
jgi:hypothetical protein